MNITYDPAFEKSIRKIGLEKSEKREIEAFISRLKDEPNIEGSERLTYHFYVQGESKVYSLRVGHSNLRIIAIQDPSEDSLHLTEVFSRVGNER